MQKFMIYRPCPLTSRSSGRETRGGRVGKESPSWVSRSSTQPLGFLRPSGESDT